MLHIGEYLKHMRVVSENIFLLELAEAEEFLENLE